MERFVTWLDGVVWSGVLIVLCLGVGLFYTVVTRFVQVRMFGEMFRLLFRGGRSEHGVSSFQAFATSVAGRVGVSNIAGVGAAIGFGGPGAIFWMWLMAFLGAATSYAECTLAQIYKEQDRLSGEYRGGPAYYFEKALHWKWYGIVFAVAAIVSCGVFLPGVQINGVVSAVTRMTGDGAPVMFLGTEIGENRLTALSVILVCLAVIIFGGIRRIARFAEYVVPFMALGYLILAAIIILLNIGELPGAVAMIVSDAFSPMAGFGAAVGWGVRRGLFSNEAGQGTGPNYAGAAEVEHPAQQGLVQAFSVYVDTLFICSATAFILLMTKTYNIQGTLPDGQFLVRHVDPAVAELGTPAFAQIALNATYGGFGDWFVAVALFFFAFTTIVAYYYIAEVNVAYLSRFFGAKMQRAGLWFSRVVIIVMVAYGGLNSAGYIWKLGDIGVGLTTWLNIIGILVIYYLSKPAMQTLRDYERQRREKVSAYTFDPVKLGIKNADFWVDRMKRDDK